MLTNRVSIALSSGHVSPTLLRTHTAALRILGKTAKLENGAGNGSGQVTLFNLPERVAPQPSIEILSASRAKTPLQTHLDAVRQLTQTTDATAITLLKRLAKDAKENVELRCEAVASLANVSLENSFLLALFGDPSSSLRIEAIRALRGRASEPPVREALGRLLDDNVGTDAALKEQARFVLAGLSVSPASDEEWRKQLAGKGEAASGRRIFFSAAAGCARCHRIAELGGQIGPDLSVSARWADCWQLMQSLLHPLRNIAPEFVAHTVTTKDGQEFTGLLIGQSVNECVTLFMADGRAVLIAPAQIESQTQSKVSLMPEGLAGALTAQDFRDLLAFLLSRR